jgi:hypothetical protein
MALLLKSGDILSRNRGMTLTEFYQQISRRLRHQFGMGVQEERAR